MRLLDDIPADWQQALEPFYSKAQAQALEAALQREFDRGDEIYPPRESIFAALKATPLQALKAVWLGQDPYHEPGQANGMAFAVQQGMAIPPSLRNIFKEYADDLGRPVPTDSTLRSWAGQGVLLLNTVLTVRAHSAGSHRKLGWQKLTQAIIQAANEKETPVAFILLGKDAACFLDLINAQRHVVFQAPHPSPLSAHRGFFGSRLFSTVNARLLDKGVQPISWL